MLNRAKRIWEFSPTAPVNSPDQWYVRCAKGVGAIMTDAGAPPVFPFGEDLGAKPVTIADGIVVLPLPTGMGVGDVNATAIREVAGPFKGGWTIVDTALKATRPRKSGKATGPGYLRTCQSSA